MRLKTIKNFKVENFIGKFVFYKGQKALLKHVMNNECIIEKDQKQIEVKIWELKFADLNAAYLVTCDFCNRAIYTEKAKNAIQFIKEIQKIGWEKSNGWQKSQSKWSRPEHSHKNLFNKLK